MFIYISQASVLLPLLSGLGAFSALNPTYRVWLSFFLFSACMEMAAGLMASRYGNNMPLLHVFTMFEFYAFLYVYAAYFRNGQGIHKLVIAAAVLFLVFAAADAFYLRGIWSLNTAAHCFETFVLVSLALCYYYRFFKENAETSVWKQPMFWTSSGVMIYFPLNLFFFMVINHLVAQNGSIAYMAINLHAAINIFANVIFAISFRCFRKPITA